MYTMNYRSVHQNMPLSLQTASAQILAPADSQAPGQQCNRHPVLITSSNYKNEHSAPAFQKEF